MSQDWYKERNKRTDSFTGVDQDCHSVKVNIAVTADSHQYSTQVALKVLLNILARWCNTISINCIDTADLLQTADRKTTLLGNLRKMILEIDPYISCRFGNTIDKSYDITVFIGKPVDNYHLPFVAIDGHGWVSTCSFNSFGSCSRATISENPIGPAFAACLANAELFRWANKFECVDYSKWYCLYNMVVDDAPIINKEEFPKLDLGRAHIVGCGAIGSSFTYLLNLCDFTGELTFVDLDHGVELHNLSSSLLFNTNDLADKKTKAVLCSEYLVTSNFLVNDPFNGDYNSFGYIHEDPQKSADLILCFANDNNIWSTIQHLYPPVVFHATTSRSSGINVGRHIPLKDNCIMCTFKDFVGQVYVPKCAEVDLVRNTADLVMEDVEPHASILPFLSPAAAILALVEVIKFIKGIIPHENTLQFNMSTINGSFISDQQKAMDCYICQDQSPLIYKQLGVKTDYL